MDYVYTYGLIFAFIFVKLILIMNTQKFTANHLWVVLFWPVSLILFIAFKVGRDNG